MSADYDIGYGRPPKDKRWKKGVSANPKGRPRKTKHAPSAALPDLGLAAPLFNRTVLAEADRRIKVNGEEKTAREGIMQALSVLAGRGGILAIRTWLDQAERAEAQLREARLPVYSSWEAFKRGAIEAIEEAVSAGKPEPLILPHPDDIILDSDNLLVKLVGPTTEEDFCFYARIKETRDLFFELMMFTKTPMINFGDPANHRIGVLGLEWLSYHMMLPKRLRGMDQCLQRMKDLLWRGRRDWEDDLRQRCEARSFDFDILSDARFMRTIPISEMGMRFENGHPVPATAKTRRELKKLIDQQGER